MPFKWLGRFRGVTFAPYIFIYKHAYRHKPKHIAIWRRSRLVNHEKIHVRQVSDEINKHRKKIGFLGYITGWVTWYAKYMGEWINNIKKYKKAAYKNISYEREAYENSSDLAYLDDREDFAHLNYKD
jgi:hypothetical protein